MRSMATALIALAVAWCQTTWAQTPTPANDIDLKLFDKAEIDRSRGCTFALWQANRDPDTDRFAIVFSEQFRGRDHLREATRIKIGNAVVPLQRIATGGKTEGYDLYPFQLYKMPDEQGYVVLDLKLEPEMGEAVEISSGKLMVTMLGKQAFRASVKGGAGCNGAPLPGPAVAGQSAASVASGAVTAGTLSAGPTLGGALQANSVPTTRNAPGNPPPQAPSRAEPPAMFERYVPRPQQVPARFLARINQRFGCTIQNQRAGMVGFQMSEESAIWQIPCDQFGPRVTSVFALVYLTAPDNQFEVLETPVPRGRERKLDPGVLMSAQWDIRNRTVTSLYPLSDKGDCGVFERFGVTPEGKFTLVEFREKANCDGQTSRPEQWPAIVGRR
jgi:hypothetical protein